MKSEDPLFDFHVHPGSVRFKRLLTVSALAAVLGTALLVPTAGPSSALPTTDALPQADNAVLTWSANAGDAAMAACISPGGNPIHEARMYAMTHVAIHDALNAIDRRSAPYAYDDEAPADTAPEAAVAAAARDVLVQVIGELPSPVTQVCIDAGVASVEADYAVAIEAIPPGQPRTRGIALGQASAAATLELRADDGSDTPMQDFDFPQGSEPGEYRFTPGQTFALAPGWAEVTPFVIEDGQHQPGAPYDVTGRKYARDVHEVKRLGGDGVTTPTDRTPDQTQIAQFWYGSAPLQWNSIGRTVAGSEHLDMWESARLFGVLNVAMSDAYVSTFVTKYHYLFWRPVTAIREAATDGNPRTDADPTWTTLLGTPPVPDYDSAHSVQGGAASAALRSVLGTGKIEFSTCSMTLPAGSRCTDASPVLRHFTSFAEAAVENASSRVYAGIHFRDATLTGTKHGRQVGRSVGRQAMILEEDLVL